MSTTPDTSRIHQGGESVAIAEIDTRTPHGETGQGQGRLRRPSPTLERVREEVVDDLGNLPPLFSGDLANTIDATIFEDERGSLHAPTHTVGAYRCQRGSTGSGSNSAHPRE